MSDDDEKERRLGPESWRLDWRPSTVEEAVAYLRDRADSLESEYYDYGHDQIRACADLFERAAARTSAVEEKLTAETLPTEDGAVVRWRGRDRLRHSAVLDFALGDEARRWTMPGIGTGPDEVLLLLLARGATDVEVFA